MKTMLMAVAVSLVAACSDPPSQSAGGEGAASTSSSRSLREDDVKAYVTRAEKRLATDVGSAPKSIEVTFEEVRIANPRTLNEQDRIDGIKGEELYPVRVKYVSHRTWGNGETEDRQIGYEYEFFRNDFGEWDALGLGPVS